MFPEQSITFSSSQIKTFEMVKFISLSNYLDGPLGLSRNSIIQEMQPLDIDGQCRL